jgi:serine/threonine protein kinase
MLYCGQRLLYNDAIVVAAFGETLLRDVFLLTTLCQSPAALASPSVIAGLSPEELSGPKALHPASEVFSLGVLLWELLANRPLFSLRDLQRATSQVISQPIPRLDRVERIGLPMPKEIASLVARALDRDPRRRMPSLDAFADAIEDLPSHFLASTDQVGNCIRRLAGGFLGETDKSSRWPIRTSSDASALLSAHESHIEEKAHNWEPETVAERKLLSSSVLEISRGVESRPSALTQRRVSKRTLAAQGGEFSRRTIGWGVALLLVTSLLLALYLWRAGPMGLHVPFNRATPRPAPRFELPHQEIKQIGELGAPATAPILLPEPSVPQGAAIASPAARPDSEATKPNEPAQSRQRNAPRRAPSKSRSGSKTARELVPEQRWGI